MRDPLQARALHIDAGSTQLTILVADLLVVTGALHAAVAEAAAVRPADLLLCATHTHSAPGGFWRGGLVERFMGPYDPEATAALVAGLAAAARESRGDAAPAALSASVVELEGASVSRRGDCAPVDAAFTLLWIDVAGRDPICALSFGAHPIAGLEREPRTITADYPGEICRRLEDRGMRALFLQGAAAGTSPAWIGLPLEEHLRRMGTALEQGFGRAWERLESVADPALGSRAAMLELGDPASIAPSGAGGPLSRLALRSLRPIARRLAREGIPDNLPAELRFAKMGTVGLLAVPCEVGPGLAIALRSLLRSTGCTVSLILSMCNGYLGYVHRYADYTRGALGPLGVYENAMALAGAGFGESMLEGAARLVAH